jgi:hypothetical protein
MGGSGLWMCFAGSGLIILGIVISMTVIGMICGIPMVIVGIPLTIYGGLKYRKHQLNELTKSIREGIVQGATAQNAGATAQNAGAVLYCAACGAPNLRNTQFCEKCGKAQS